MIIDILSKIITEAAKSLGYEEDLRVIKSKRLDLCDYQCDEVFRLSKAYHKNPQEIGESIASKVNELECFNDYFSSVEFCAPGFINIKLSNKFINKLLIDMNNNDKFNLPVLDKVETYVLDYGGPNVAKPLHVGHLRPAIIGESIKRIINYVGHKTISDVHLGDIGLPIGEVIYALKSDNLSADDITLEYLNEVYPKMSALVKVDDIIKDECASIIKDVQDQKDYLDYWKKICEISTKDIKRLYDYLGVSFDYWYGESDAYRYIPEVKKFLLDKDLLKESQGALVVFVNKVMDKIEYPPMIFEKSNGAYLYESSDLATIYQRVLDFNPDHILYVTDARQAMHFEQVFRVCELSHLTDNIELRHLPNGTVNGVDGKPYKTRSGKTPKLDELFQEAKETFIAKKESNKDMKKEDIDIIVNAILKFADLQNSRDKDYIFDISKFSETTGKTGPYILYTYLRMNKIIEKYDTNIDSLSNNIYNDCDRDLRIGILDLESYIMSAFREMKPNYIAEYVYNLCVLMNSFYQNNHISNIEDETKLNDWVSIIKLANKIIKDMLNLLIIDIPTEM